MKKMLDLCAGFGGQSEAFHRAGWEVLRIDNNPLLSEVENMVIMDLFDVAYDDVWAANEQIEYVHAGPTCLQFSTAMWGPRGIAERAGEDYYPDDGVKLVKKCMSIIEQVNPRYWSLENVRGSIKYLKPFLGEPRLIIGPYVYWGNFPLFACRAEDLPSKADLDKRWSPLRMNHRAQCPFELSFQFWKAMESQKSVLDFCRIPE